jgi:hypothetical protein
LTSRATAEFSVVLPGRCRRSARQGASTELVSGHPRVAPDSLLDPARPPGDSDRSPPGADRPTKNRAARARFRPSARSSVKPRFQTGARQAERVWPSEAGRIDKMLRIRRPGCRLNRDRSGPDPPGLMRRPTRWGARGSLTCSTRSLSVEPTNETMLRLAEPRSRVEAQQVRVL